jgi:hypothetical protein
MCLFQWDRGDSILRQATPDDCGMVAGSVQKASIVEIIVRIVKRRGTFAITGENKTARHMC